MHKIFRDSIGIFAAQIIGIIAGVLTGILTARALGPDGKGLYVLAFVLPGMISAFGNLGLGQSLVYFLAKDRDRTASIMSAFLAIFCVLSVVLVCGSWIALPFVGPVFFPEVPPLLLSIGLFSLPFSLWVQLSRNYFRGTGKFSTFNWLGLLPKIAIPVFLFLAFLIQKDTTVAVAVNTATTALVAVLCLLLIVAGLRRFQFSSSSRFVRPLLDYGIRVYPGYLFQTLEHRGDFLLLSFFGTSPTQVGLYSVAVTVAEMVLYVSESVGTVWLQHVASENSAADIENRTAQLSRLVLCIGFAVALGAALLAYPAINLLYGSAFAPAVIPLIILLPGLVARCPERIVGAHLQGVNKPGLVSTISAASLTLNVISNILLIPVFGIYGAALSSTVSYMVRSSMVLVAYSSSHGQSLKSHLLVTSGDVALILNLVLPDKTRDNL